MEVADSSSSCNVHSLTLADGYSATADESLLMQTWKNFFSCFCVSYLVIVIDSLTC
jgi:hypothetical protein